MEARSFDGHRVEETLARLAGTFAVDLNDADHLIADQTVVAVVVARVSGANEKIMRGTGIVRRTNVLDVNQFAIVREPELQQMLIEHLPQLDTPVLDEIPQVAAVPQDTAVVVAPEWVPPLAVQSDEPLFRAKQPVEQSDDPDDDEVFSPSNSGGGQRMPVGGARFNDKALARFLNGMEA